MFNIIYLNQKPNQSYPNELSLTAADNAVGHPYRYGLFLVDFQLTEKLDVLNFMLLKGHPTKLRMNRLRHFMFASVQTADGGCGYAVGLQIFVKLSFFDKYLLKKFGALIYLPYICISKNDK